MSLLSVAFTQGIIVVQSEDGKSICYESCDGPTDSCPQVTCPAELLEANKDESELVPVEPGQMGFPGMMGGMGMGGMMGPGMGMMGPGMGMGMGGGMGGMMGGGMMGGGMMGGCGCAPVCSPCMPW